MCTSVLRRVCVPPILLAPFFNGLIIPNGTDHHHQGAKSLDSGSGLPHPHISASGSGHGLSSLVVAADPGLLFASNQSHAETETVASTTTAGLSTLNGTRPLIMDYQQAGLEAEGLLAAAAAKRRSRRLVYMRGFCASLTSILLGYDVRWD